MSVAEDTTHIPEVIVAVDAAAAAVIVEAVVNDLQTAISNTFESPENATKTILEESQAVIDETTKLIEEIAATMVEKNEPIVTEPVIDDSAKPIVKEETPAIVNEPIKTIVSEAKTIVDETTKLVESVVKTGENIANIVSEEEKRLTETISRLSIEMEQHTKKATGLFAKIHKFVKLISSCTHRADKSVVTADVDVKVDAVV
jgi:hypothetical protein